MIEEKLASKKIFLSISIPYGGLARSPYLGKSGRPPEFEICAWHLGMEHSELPTGSHPVNRYTIPLWWF